MRNILIEKVNETMKKSPGLFKSIMPQKIFTDMYQFFQSQLPFMVHQRRTSSLTDKDPGTTTLSMEPKLINQTVDFKATEEAYSPSNVQSMMLQPMLRNGPLLDQTHLLDYQSLARSKTTFMQMNPHHNNKTPPPAYNNQDLDGSILLENSTTGGQQSIMKNHSIERYRGRNSNFPL